MNLFLLGAIAGVVVLLLVAIAVLWAFKVNPLRTAQQPLVPVFHPRRHPPRAITRITKDQLDWEIN